METKKKVRKVAPSSDSSSSESSSDSSSEEKRRKMKHRNIRKQQRESSSSTEEETVRKSHKHSSHKKSSARKHSHAAKVRAKLVQSSSKKAARSMSPNTRAAHKHHLKAKMAAKKAKLAQLEEHERRSRTPTRRDVKKDRTPDHRIASPTTRIRVSVPNNRAVRERSAGRGIKDSPSARSRHIREPACSEKERAEILARCQERQRDRDRVKRIQEEDDRYKHVRPSDRSRILPIVHPTPEKHRHERSRSTSRGKIPIRERLDKVYDYHRSISREHEEYPLMRASGSVREPLSISYSRDRPAPRDEPERSFDYRSEDRRIASHEYGQPTRNFDERHRRTPNWEAEREMEPRSSRAAYEGRDWDVAHPKRMADEPYKDPRDRSWNEPSHDKWLKEKDPKEWNRNWKEPSGHGPPSSSSAPTMPHPRRWPGPSQPSEPWTPRGAHPASHKIEHSPSAGPPFKPRFAGPGSTPGQYGFKRFPFKRFPNQYSKINYPSKRVIPSGPLTPGQGPSKSAESSVDSPMKSDIEQLPATPSKLEPSESGEITTEPEEDKVEADTTFSGNVEPHSQEECEGNLSEFSDIDDEILNREEELARGAAAELNASGDEDQNGDHDAQKIISKIHANNELKKEMDLDFEEISDGELEEESRIKGLGDALGVDWESLQKETQRPVKHDPEAFMNTTKSRWSAHRVLWDTGVSAKLAGEDFTREILTKARNELRREKQDIRMKMAQLKLEKSEKSEMTNGDVKKEPTINDETGDEVKIKDEPRDDDIDNQAKVEEAAENGTPAEPDDILPLEDFELDDDVLPHPCASIQVVMRQLATKRRNLILHPKEKYGRALSARRDLKIRRVLCNLPTKDIKVDRSCSTVTPELRQYLDDIYKKLSGEVS